MKKFKLNLGCGSDKDGLRKKGFTNVDVGRGGKVDIIEDASILKSIKNNTVDEIVASHIIEHFQPDQALIAVKRWLEILKPAGVLRIETPNIIRCAEMLLSEGVNLSSMIGFYGTRYGKKKKMYELHNYGYTPKSLTKILKKIGFVRIRVVKTKMSSSSSKRDMAILSYKGG